MNDSTKLLYAGLIGALLAVGVVLLVQGEVAAGLAPIVIAGSMVMIFRGAMSSASRASD